MESDWDGDATGTDNGELPADGSELGSDSASDAGGGWGESSDGGEWGAAPGAGRWDGGGSSSMAGSSVHGARSMSEVEDGSASDLESEAGGIRPSHDAAAPWSVPGAVESEDDEDMEMQLAAVMESKP